MADKDSFLMHNCMWEPISDLPNEQLGMLLRAIFEYHIDGKEPENTSVITRDFRHLKKQFVLDMAKYEVVRSRNIQNGKHGGRPRNPNNPDNPNETEENPNNPVGFQEPRKADNGNVYDNVIISSPISPSSPEVEEGLKKKPRKKTKEETTVEAAVSHYQTEVAAAREDCAPGAEDYAKLASEICGKVKTVECPNGMVRTIMRLPEQLYFAQYRKMVAKMGNHETVRSILLEMHNGFEEYLSKGRSSMYLIALDWYKNRLKKDHASGQNGTAGGLKPPRRVEQP
jgi:hypothetical protein